MHVVHPTGRARCCERTGDPPFATLSSPASGTTFKIVSGSVCW